MDEKSGSHPLVEDIMDVKDAGYIIPIWYFDTSADTRCIPMYGTNTGQI
jgi:hypothetical protein